MIIFTGIIEDVGKVKNIRRQSNSLILEIKTDLVDKLELGDSIAVNGPCLTVTELNEKSETFKCEVTTETFRKTNLNNLKPGHKVNLENSLQLNSKLGGHLVTGHIDGIGTIKNIKKKENSWIFTIRPPKDLKKYLAPKGSVSIDGISLTIVDTERSIDVSITNFTYENTILKEKGVGDKVNIEVDILSRYIEQLKLNNDDSNKKDSLEILKEIEG